MPLRGELFIAGRQPLYAPSDQAKNTHSYLTVEGPAALQMYKTMKAPEQTDLCLEGHQLKRAGKISCSLSADRRNATCDFGIDLVKGVLADGKPC